MKSFQYNQPVTDGLCDDLSVANELRAEGHTLFDRCPVGDFALDEDGELEPLRCTLRLDVSGLPCELSVAIHPVYRTVIRYHLRNLPSWPVAP